MEVFPPSFLYYGGMNMILLSNDAVQTIQPGESLTFNKELLHTGNAECHREGSSALKLRCCGVYEVHFHANVGGTAVGTVQLQLEAGGEVLPETTMIVTEDTVGSLENVSVTTLLKNCCGDYNKITVTNTGTIAAAIGANPAFFAKRLS